MDKECQYCFEKESNCVCVWNNCATCKAKIPDSEAYEYRGFIFCTDCFDEGVKKVDYKRAEVHKAVEASTKSQVNGEWMNGGYKTMKVDKGGKPITKIKEPQILKDYENGVL